MVETLCTSGAVKLKAGANAPTLTAADYTQAINQAEAFISANSKYDWVANYASVPANSKPFLEDATSSKAAIIVINNNMAGFTSRTEAQVMLNVNNSILVDEINLIRDDKFRTFLQKGMVE